MTSNSEDDKALAKQLYRTWDPFFQKHKQLTPIQRMAIPEILSGSDALIMAPTASGKTEAACAPLLERALGPGSPRLILYVCPTRALVNDLFSRLERPVGELGRLIARRTADHRVKLTRDHGILITTPESFDILLCNGIPGRDMPHSLADVGAVVLDEIHLLAGNPRGEQVRWLIERLRRLRRQAAKQKWSGSDTLQVVAISATVNDPEWVRDRFVPGGRIIASGGQREIMDWSSVAGYGPTEEILADFVRERPEFRKVIVFSNSRRRVDMLASDLGPKLKKLGFGVLAHHGSLERPIRAETEDLIRLDNPTIVFSTSTLELGIDIGDIDLVVLDDPAPDMPSLFQRIGRGNRRKATTAVLPCSSHQLNVLVQSSMLACAHMGWIGPADRGPHFAVIRQQIASYIAQSPKGSRSTGNIRDLFRTLDVEEHGNQIVEHMVRNNELISADSALRLGLRFPKSSLHSVIEEMGGYSVLDAHTGSPVAKGLSAQSGSSLGVGGIPLEVQGRRGFQILVERVSSDILSSGEWRYASRSRMTGSSQPASIRHAADIPGDIWPVIRGRRGWWVFHLGGGRLEILIKLATLDDDGIDSASINEWAFRLGLDPTDGYRLVLPDYTVFNQRLGANLEQLETQLGRPRANQRLPRQVRVKELQGWLDFGGFAHAYKHVRMIPGETNRNNVLKGMVSHFERS